MIQFVDSDKMPNRASGDEEYCSKVKDRIHKNIFWAIAKIGKAKHLKTKSSPNE